MYPAAFEYCAPATLAEAIERLAESGGGDEEPKLISGGQSLLPMLKLRLVRPSLLVDLRRVPGLAEITRAPDGSLRIGARVTHAELEDSDLLRQHYPLLQETAATIGDRQVRHLGTIGGSLAHADPTADWAAAALASDAVIYTHGPAGGQSISAADFLKDSYETALGPSAVLTAISFPPSGGRASGAYLKFPNPASRYALAGVAVRLLLNDSDRVLQARVGVTGVGPIAYRARAMEAALEGQRLTAASLRAAAALAADGVDPLEDTYAAPDYRAHLASVVAQRAAERALSRLGVAPT